MDLCTNGSDQSDVMACVLEDGLHHEGGSRLALGSGDTDYLQFFCGIIEVSGRQLCESDTGVLRLIDDNVCKISGLICGLAEVHIIFDHDKSCSLGCSFRCKCMAIERCAL